MLTDHADFRPDWVSSPGDTIADILAKRRISISEFADSLEQTVEEVTDLLQGRSTITIRTARTLEHTLGASIEFWMTRDFRYREAVKKIRDADEAWLSELPLGDMIKFGWLHPRPTPSEEMAACLQFFDVPTVGAWEQKYAAVEHAVPFRTSASFDARPAAVAAWLRQGEIEAKNISCAPWNPALLESALEQIRPLTRVRDPRQFLPRLQQLCAAAGVAVVVVRAPTGCRASGAVFFSSPDKAVLLLSFRYLSDDHFWFTFFHEAAHLILHANIGLFLEGIEGDGMLTAAEEQEANGFASSVLVPATFRERLGRLPIDPKSIIAFAREVGISRGIVVGQLQHLGRLKYSQMNSLKKRFEWTK